MCDDGIDHDDMTEKKVPQPLAVLRSLTTSHMSLPRRGSCPVSVTPSSESPSLSRPGNRRSWSATRASKNERHPDRDGEAALLEAIRTHQLRAPSPLAQTRLRVCGRPHPRTPVHYDSVGREGSGRNALADHRALVSPREDTSVARSAAQHHRSRSSPLVSHGVGGGLGAIAERVGDDSSDCSLPAPEAIKTNSVARKGAHERSSGVQRVVIDTRARHRVTRSVDSFASYRDVDFTFGKTDSPTGTNVSDVKSMTRSKVVANAARSFFASLRARNTPTGNHPANEETEREVTVLHQGRGTAKHTNATVDCGAPKVADEVAVRDSTLVAAPQSADLPQEGPSALQCLNRRVAQVRQPATESSPCDAPQSMLANDTDGIVVSHGTMSGDAWNSKLDQLPRDRTSEASVDSLNPSEATHSGGTSDRARMTQTLKGERVVFDDENFVKIVDVDGKPVLEPVGATEWKSISVKNLVQHFQGRKSTNTEPAPAAGAPITTDVCTQERAPVVKDEALKLAIKSVGMNQVPGEILKEATDAPTAPTVQGPDDDCTDEGGRQSSSRELRGVEGIANDTAWSAPGGSGGVITIATATSDGIVNAPAVRTSLPMVRMLIADSREPSSRSRSTRTLSPARLHGAPRMLGRGRRSMPAAESSASKAWTIGGSGGQDPTLASEEGRGRTVSPSRSPGSDRARSVAAAAIVSDLAGSTESCTRPRVAQDNVKKIQECSAESSSSKPTGHGDAGSSEGGPVAARPKIEPGCISILDPKSPSIDITQPSERRKLQQAGEVSSSPPFSAEGDRPRSLPARGRYEFAANERCAAGMMTNTPRPEQQATFAASPDDSRSFTDLEQKPFFSPCGAGSLPRTLPAHGKFFFATSTYAPPAPMGGVPSARPHEVTSRKSNAQIPSLPAHGQFVFGATTRPTSACATTADTATRSEGVEDSSSGIVTVARGSEDAGLPEADDYAAKVSAVLQDGATAGGAGAGTGVPSSRPALRSKAPSDAASSMCSGGGPARQSAEEHAEGDRGGGGSSSSSGGGRVGREASLRVLLQAEALRACAAIGGGGFSEESGEQSSARYFPLRGAGSGAKLSTIVREFLASERKVFLLTGEAGSGKSFFAASLARELASTCDRAGLLPVLLDARESDGPLVGGWLDGLLERRFACLGSDVDLIREQQRLLLIFDGFEKFASDRRCNLWTTNGWAHWRMKALITSRSSALARTVTQSPESLFVPTDQKGVKREWALQTASIAPLRPDEVHTVLLNVRGGEGTRAMGHMVHVASNRNLGSHPLTLDLAVRAARAEAEGGGRGGRSSDSNGKNGGLEAKTKAGVISCWLDATLHSLDPANSKFVHPLERAEDAAFAMYQSGRWTLDALPVDDEHGSLKKLMMPIDGRSSLWAFSSSSVLEYLVASRVRRVLVKTRAGGMVGPGATRGCPDDASGGACILSALNIGSSRAVPGVVPHAGAGLVSDFLAEMASADEDFAVVLLGLISKSAGEGTADLGGGRIKRSQDHMAAVEIAAANAIAVLCRAGHSFAGTDLSRVKIPGAVLDGGIFDGCSFYKADLTGCSLKGASLRRCNLSRANLTGVNVRLLPGVQLFGTGKCSGAAGGGADRATRDFAKELTRRERIGVEISADGEAFAVIEESGRSMKVFKTRDLEESCHVAPDTGRLLSADLLVLSPDKNYALVYTEDDPTMNRFAVPKGRQLELRSLRDPAASVVFEAASAPGWAVPTFYADSSRFVYQHGASEVSVVECSSGDTLDTFPVELCLEDDEDGRGSTTVSGTDGTLPAVRRTTGEKAEDVWPTPAQKICSLTVTPDQTKVLVGLDSPEEVILAFDLLHASLYDSEHQRTGHEALSGRRIIDASPTSGEGLYAVLGPDRALQIRSWRSSDVPIDGGAVAIGDRSQGGPNSSGSDGSAAVREERELARLRCGDEETIEELAFARTGEFFVTRDSQRGTTSLWSAKPDVALVQWMENVSCRMSAALFLPGDKAVALAHNDCTVKVYSCATGEVLVSRDVPSPAISVAVVRAPEQVRGTFGSGEWIMLVAITGEGEAHRWLLPGWTSLLCAGRSEEAGSGGGSPGLPAGALVRAAVALPTALAEGTAKADFDGRLLVLFAGHDGLLAIDAERGIPARDLAGRACDGGFSHLAVTPDGKTIVSVQENNDMVVWDAKTCTPQQKRRLPSETRALAISPDSVAVAVLGFDGITIHEIGGTPPDPCPERWPSTSSLASLRRGFAIGRADDAVKIAFWDAHTLAVAYSRGRIQLLTVGPRRHGSSVIAPANFSQGSSASSPAVDVEWIAHAGSITCMAMRPTPCQRAGLDAAATPGDARAGMRSNGRAHSLLTRHAPALATGGGDGKVNVWTDEGKAGSYGADEIIVAGANECGEAAPGSAGIRGTGHEGAVLSVCWHPGGQLLASAGQDWAIWLWDSEGRPVSYVHAHRRWSHSLTFSACGGFLVSCARGGSAGWRVALMEQGQVLTLRWRHPQTLTATRAELDGAVGLSAECSQILRDRGAVTAADAELAAARGHNESGVSSDASRAGAMKLTSRVADSDEADWTIDGVKPSVSYDGRGQVDAKDERGMTALLLASKSGQGHLVDFLISAGADVEAKDRNGYTPLCWAAAGGYSTVLHALLFSSAADNHESLPEAHGADPDFATHEGDTPAILAARGGHLCALVELEEGGADVDASNFAGETPLIAASRAGHVEVVALIAGNVGTDLDRRESVDGFTALAAAALSGWTACVRVLLARGADPMVTSTDGRSPAALAAFGGHLAALRLVLGAVELDPKAAHALRPDSAGRTPAMAAASNGHVECLCALLESAAASTDGGDIDVQDSEGRTALMYACTFDQPACVEYLLSRGARIDTGDKSDVIALMLAARGGHEACMTLLLGAVAAAAGGDDDSRSELLDVADMDGNNASHYACRAGEVRALALLADAGASLDHPSGESEHGTGLRPAHLAVAHGFLFCLQELAARKVDLEATDGEGDTVLSLAVESGSDACVEYLLSVAESGGSKPRVDPNRPGSRQEGALSAAARRGKRSLVTLLLRAGADPAAADGTGETALHAAARHGHVHAIEALAQTVRREGDQSCSSGRNGYAYRTKGGGLPSWWQVANKQHETATFLAARAGHAGVCRALHAVGALDPSRPNVDGVTPMVAAALAGSAEVIDALVEGGGDVNHADRAGRTPAMAAALRGDQQLLRFLCSSGADLAVPNTDGRTAAFFAAMSGHLDCLELILDGDPPRVAGSPASTDAPDKIGCTPLWTAAAHGHLDVVRYLTAWGASPNARDVTGTTAAWMTAGSGKRDCLEALLKAGADGNEANEDGLTPSLVAAQGGHASCLVALGKSGVDLTITDFGGNSAAALAAMGGHLDCLEVLRASGADMDVPNSDGHTPVFAAITHGRLDCLHALAGYGAVLSRRDLTAGNTPTMVAASHGRTECLRYVVKRAGRHLLAHRNEDGLSPTYFAVLCGRDETLAAIGELNPSLLLDRDPTGRSVPHYAAAEGKVDCLRIAKEACAAAPGDPPASHGSAGVMGWWHGSRPGREQSPLAACLDQDGDSPLHVASRAGHVDAFEFLVREAGVRPEKPNARGETCPWIAAAYGRVPLLRILLRNGVDANTPDKNGRSPVHAAARNNHSAALQELASSAGESASAVKFDTKDHEGATPMHYAAAAGHLEAVAALIETGADVNATDKLGKTPAWRATIAGQAAILDLLASKGAMLNGRTDTGATLAHVAARVGHSSCLRVLCQRSADVDAVNDLGNTPAMFAAMIGELDSIRALARRGCDLSKKDRQNVTPAFFAAQEGHAECLSLLLSLGADGGVPRADGATPLIMASQNGHDACLRVLLSARSNAPPPPPGDLGKVRHDAIPAGSIPNSGKKSAGRDYRDDIRGAAPPLAGLESRTSSGYTALCMAVVAGQQRCVEELLSSGADIEAADRKGRSPLFLAVAAEDTPMCDALIVHGAQPRRKAADGFEPAFLAAVRGHTSVARKIARAAGVRPEDMLDFRGVALSEVIRGAERKSAARDGGVAKSGEGRKGCRDADKCVAALLPTSVARAPSAAIEVAVSLTSSSASNGGTTDTGSASNASDAGDASPVGGRGSQQSKHQLASASSVGQKTAAAIRTPRRGRAPRRPGSRATGRESKLSPAGRPPPGVNGVLPRSGSSGVIVEADTEDINDGWVTPPPRIGSSSPWSGVHGGERHSTTVATPGRRKPVVDFETKRKESNDVSTAGSQQGVRRHELAEAVVTGGAGGGQEDGQKHETLLSRMTAFLLDGVRHQPKSSTR